MSKAIRAFIAIDLPDAAAAAVARLQETLPVGRPTSAETLHLTLAFLGEQREAQIAEVHDGLQHLSASRFDLRLAGLDVFGGSDPRVLFVGAAQNEALDRLHKLVRAAMRSAGIELRRERFRPHVTLARFRRGMLPAELDQLRRFLAAHGDFCLPPFPVTGFTLYQSRLHPDGAVHDALALYPLR